MSDLKSQIQQIISGDVLDTEADLKSYSHDASVFEIKPQLIVAPRDVSDVKKLVKFVSNSKDNLSITPRSAGTDMSGGAINDSILLDMTKHFHQVIDVGAKSAVVQPGVYYRDFEKQTLQKNLLLPSYPASREICSVGGMVANNASGEKTLTFGATEKFVQSLKVVLSDGNEYNLEPLTKSELDKKIKQTDFEGSIYKRLFDLVDKNYGLIQSSKPKTSKNSSGYFLWNLWDKKTFDLTKIFSGSQGTLGIITQINFRLIKPKPYSNLLVIFLYDLSHLSDIVSSVLHHQPESFESYDDQTMEFAFKFLPQVLKVIRPHNLLSLIWGFMPEALMVLKHGFPKLVLLAEFTADTQKEAFEKSIRAKMDLEMFHVKMRTTKDADETKKYWTIRRESFNLFRQHAGGKQTVPFIDDIIVNPEHYKKFLPKLNALLAPYKKDMVYTIAGHIGNGNFHIIPLMDLKNPRTFEIIKELTPKVNELVLSYQGSLTAEHNDGLIRGPYLKQQYGEKMFELFKQVKQIFDPKGIFNPHKKIGATLEYSYRHLKQS